MESSMVSISALDLFFLSSLVMAAEENRLSREQILPAISSAFQKQFLDARQASCLQEVKDGKTVYEIEFKHNGNTEAAFYTQDGSLLETEKAINTTELPALIANSIKRAHPNAVVKQAEVVSSPDGTVRGCEIDATARGKMIGLALDSSGKILSADSADAYSAPIPLPVEVAT